MCSWLVVRWAARVVGVLAVGVWVWFFFCAVFGGGGGGVKFFCEKMEDIILSKATHRCLIIFYYQLQQREIVVCVCVCVCVCVGERERGWGGERGEIGVGGAPGRSEGVGEGVSGGVCEPTLDG